jgi:cardiolipin synthase C
MNSDVESQVRRRNIQAKLCLTLIGSLAFTLVSCGSLPPPKARPKSTALPPGDSTALDIAISALEVGNADSSGFLLLDSGRVAFASRAQATLAAQRSIDVQTYIWHADQTGKYLAHELLRAADRGVHVRLLLDDLDARKKNNPLLALDSHKNIEVRLFNPLASRQGFMGAVGEGFSSFQRLNHRMHTKNWIVDNRIAIAGGRNVGDEYFAASDETNFADMDWLMIGNVVRDGSIEFDRFWNSDIVYSITELNPELSKSINLDDTRTILAAAAEDIKSSRYANELRNDATLKHLMSGDVPLHWVTDYHLVADDPLKLNAKTPLEQSSVLKTLLPLIQNAKHEVIIASPYFVPGKAGTELLVATAQRGVSVKILTNSLAANDVAAVHGGYSKYRKALLEGGVQLWELKPIGGSQADPSLLGSSGASLHAKAFSFDGEGLFIGSYNLDARSTSLNAEMGIYVHDAEVTSQFNSLFKSGNGASAAWHVTLIDNKLSWSDGEETLNSEPHASLWRRFQAWITRVFPFDPLL